MNAIRTIFVKEFTDNLRDRRSVLSILGYALLGPGMILLMIVILGNVFQESLEKPLELPISGREHAPALVHFLEQQNVILQDAPEDPREAVRDGEVDVVLVIPPAYAEDFTDGKPAGVELIIDTSRTSASPTIRRAEGLLEQYGQQIGALRLLARGISPSIVAAVTIEDVDVSTPQSQAFIFLNMLPYFLVMTVFLGSAPVIIDTTAGERERDSLEPLLINPVRRWELVLGKLLAALPFAIGTLLVSIGAFGAVFNLIPVEQFMGMQLSVSPVALASIFLICLPMVLLAGALQMIIATFTHTYKEAQSYVNWLPLIPALPGLVLAFLPIRETIGAMLIPTYGQQMLINQLIRGDTVDPLHVVVSTAATLAVSVLLTLIAIRLYTREEVLFGKR